MYINDEKLTSSRRTDNRYNSDGTLNSTNVTQVVDKHVYRHKDAIKQGDKVKALPYFHGTIAMSAKDTTLRYKWGYVNNARWGWYLWASVNDQPTTPSGWTNPFFNVYARHNSSLIYHGKYAAADMKALLKLRQQKVDIGTMVAEFSETVVWLGRKARTLIRTAIALKSGKYHKALHEIGISSKAWSKVRFHDASARFLEWKFAIMPLVHDIADINKLIETKLTDLDLLTVSVSGKESVPLSSAYSSSFYRGVLTTLEYDMVQTMRTKIVATVTDLEKVVQASVGLNSYAVPAYELVPYSWLVDYVFNVGDLLKAATATVGLSFIDGYQSTKLLGFATRTTDQDYSSYMNSSGVEPKRIRSSTKVAVRGYIRSTLGAFPLPQFQFVLPAIKAGQVANVVALLHVLIATKSRYIPPQ